MISNRAWNAVHRVLPEPAPAPAPNRFGWKMRPAERAIHAMRGHKFPPMPKRDDGASFNPATGKVETFLRSKHLTPSGVLFRKFMRLRRRNQGDYP